ncbi:hypothetical protein OIE62_00870 [Streptomyces scopuliridis]|uniref:Uncharacterized protein n=1 Tax=Streptomyces scopuliridis TaxID=452529 RepID=A0ACD4ZXW1_9ACTN|nr:hypothetical protein [Streptomyces scopuliridis]WSB38300.1 hypothetical protein OG949_39440 [Streptomyces scopuliridis]WSC02739.1 hypothetical protein OG835_40965 [Streptomyces scopuliridis]WSC03728.1 hypothetical protein OIE62_00870 [Streptomyces scopuliridis]
MLDVALVEEPAAAEASLARWLPALRARLIQEVGMLLTATARARRRAATFGIDMECGRPGTAVWGHENESEAGQENRR